MSAAAPTPGPHEGAAVPGLPAKGPAPRRWLRRTAWALGLLLLLVLLAPLLVGLGPVRTKIAEAAGEALGQKVEIESTSAYWFRGIDLEGITVESPTGFDGPLATIQRVHVDIDLLGLLGGKVSADVRILEPHVTLRRDAQGRGNQDGVVEHLQAGKDKDEKAPTGPTPELNLIVIGGRFEAAGTAGTDTNVVDDVQVTLALAPSGRMLVDLEARLVDAARGGGHARVQATADLDAEGTGPVSFEAPALELARIAQLVENATGLRGLQGSVEGAVQARLLGDRTLEGTLTLSAAELGATMADNSRLALKSLDVRVDLKSLEGATEAGWLFRLQETEVSRQRNVRTETFREPLITFEGTGRYSASDGLVRIAKARLDAGQTAAAEILAPLRIETDPVPRIQGKASARLDLQRLGELRGFAPQLASLAGGSVQAAFDGRGGEGIDADVELRVADLHLRPSSYAPEGYSDRQIVIAFNARQSRSEGTRITLQQLESALVQASFRKDRGLAFQLDPEGRPGVDGAFQLRVQLPVLSLLAGDALGLARGERIAGTVTLAGSGLGEEGRMRLDTTVEANDVVLPRSWSPTPTRTNLRALLRIDSSTTSTSVRLSELRGMGLSGEGDITLVPAGDSLRMEEASARLGLQLGAARGWLAPLLDLTAQERLDGTLSTALRLGREDDGRRLQSTTQVENLLWDRGAGTTPIQERRLSLQTSALLAPEGGRHRAEQLLFEGAGLRIDLSGSTYVAEPDTDLDATLRLGGDAAKLAPLLQAFLGEGYEDLRGRGPFSGEVHFSGGPGDNGRSLLINGSLGLASWSSGGVNVSNTQLAVRRAALGDPLTTSFTAGMNKGSVAVNGSARLGDPQIPWNAKVKVAQVDTSGLLVSQGLGRYLAFALPALLPAGTNTPVLSGLLDADLEGRAPSIEDPELASGLTGKGVVHMSGGEIKQSTLFGGGEGGKLTKLIGVLKVAIPEAALVLEELSRAVTFSTLDSRFQVANKVLVLEEAKLVGQSAHIDMKGRVDFEQRVALETNVTLQGGGGRALAKVLPGGTIPLRVRGTLEQPQVTPNVDLTKLAAGGIAGKLPGVLDDIKKKLPGGIPNPFGR